MGPLGVQQNGVKGGGPLPPGLNLRPQLHPQRILIPPQQAEAVSGLAVLPGGIQKGLQQLRPVLRLHQNIQVGAAVQQLPAAPAGEGAQSRGKGEAPDSRPAQLQGQHGPRQVLRQETGVLPGGVLPHQLQNAGGNAVLRLVTGDFDLPIQRRGVRKGGGGAGESHIPQGFQRLQRRGGEHVGEPPAVQLLCRQAQ